MHDHHQVGHDHHPHHHHHHGDTSRIGWAFWLNFVFTLIEFVGGMLTNSVAILADAVHDLGDCMSIGLAWYLGKVSHKEATNTYTYGYRRLSLLGAMINGLILVLGSAWVLSEAIPRLADPQMPVTEGMMGLAVLGIIANGAAVVKLQGAKTLNEKVLNWHLLEDVLGWVAVLIVAIVLHFVHWPILDPLLSIVFTLFILFNVACYVWQTGKLFLQANPDEDQQQAIHEALSSVPHVVEMHHVHFWSLDGEHHVLTAHLVLSVDADATLLKQLKAEVTEKLSPFSLAHTTIEFELPGEPCRDEDVPNTEGHTHKR